MQKKVNGHTIKLGTDYTGEHHVRADGHVIAKKRVTAVCRHDDCAKPNKEFVCVITTKPPFYCPECQEEVIRRRRALDIEKARARKREDGTTAPPKKRKLIRYAGYDGSND
jgi:hypothetical protein